MPGYKGLSKYQLERKFTEEYCKEHRLFGYIRTNQHWFITGVGTAFIFSLLGVIVNDSVTLGYSGFVIGALADYFMRKEYDKELEKFEEGRSVWNGRVYHEED